MDENKSLVNEQMAQSALLAYRTETKTKSLLFYAGSAFALIALVSAGALIYMVMTKYPLGITLNVVNESRHPELIYLDAYSGGLILLLTLFLSSSFAFFSYKAAGNINRKVIPDSDKELLTQLIIKDDQGIDQYIRLSSLSGTTGFFTKLGLTGLPLATIGLTIIFALVALLSNNQSFNDLAKLTLGAFLGSYVQKGTNPIQALPKKKDDDKTQTGS